MAEFTSGQVPAGDVVKEFYLGKTRVLICADAYLCRTPEDIELTRGNIGRIALEALLGKAVHEEDCEPCGNRARELKCRAPREVQGDTKA